jgi:hypothetical protein
MGKVGKKRAGVAKLESMVKSKGAVQKSTGGWGVQSIPGLPQEERISYALQKLLVIEVPEGAPFSDFQRALSIVTSAWNISLHVPEEQSGLIQEILVNMFGQEDDDIKREIVHLFERLIISKGVFFPDDKRLVTFSEVIQKGNKLAVTAIGIDTSVKENLAVVNPDGGFDAQ